MPDYKWTEIQDLPPTWKGLAANDLASLAEVWNEQREKLGDSESLKRFNTQLQRQWAIETGIVEGLYTIDSGVTRLLIEKGIEGSLIPHGSTNKPVETILPIIKDQQHVIEGLFDFVGHSRPLSTSYVKELHQALTAHQQTVEAYDQFGNRHRVPMLRGTWKVLPNNPTRSDATVHEYCPPEHVASEMDRLIAMHLAHKAIGVSPEVEAAWLHHRFTQIHPFHDGNGRVARALASLVLLRAKWFPLTIVSDRDRERYISALEKADHGELEDLVELFAGLQKQALIQALSTSRDVIADGQSLTAVISSAASKVRGRLEEEHPEKRQVFEIADALAHRAEDFLNSVRDRIRQEFSTIDPLFSFDVDVSTPYRKHWLRNEVIATARHLAYFADLDTYHTWLRLTLRRQNDRQAEVVVSFHSLGTEFLGVIAASAFIEHKNWGEDGNVSLDGPYPVNGEAFQFTYNQDRQSVAVQFDKWLNNAIVAGLDQWRRQL